MRHIKINIDIDIHIYTYWCEDSIVERCECSGLAKYGRAPIFDRIFRRSRWMQTNSVFRIQWKKHLWKYKFKFWREKTYRDFQFSSHFFDNFLNSEFGSVSIISDGSIATSDIVWINNKSQTIAMFFFFLKKKHRRYVCSPTTLSLMLMLRPHTYRHIHTCTLTNMCSSQFLAQISKPQNRNTKKTLKSNKENKIHTKKKHGEYKMCVYVCECLCEL